MESLQERRDGAPRPVGYGTFCTSTQYPRPNWETSRTSQGDWSGRTALIAG